MTGSVTDLQQLSTHRRSFYSDEVAGFLRTTTDTIVGRLSTRHVAFHASAEAEQVRAWEREIEILKMSLREVGERAERWSILIEVPLLRLAKRLDVILLTTGCVAVIEFKTGAGSFDGAAVLQTERYAQSLRDFHEASRSQLIVPILCAENAVSKPLAIEHFDGVARILLTNASSISQALAMLADVNATASHLDALTFQSSAYRPTPTIVEAAQALYAGHQIEDIGRGDAADAELQAAAQILQGIAAKAEAEKAHIVCFVTGSPGSGKTLLGLDLALKSRSGTRPAALLSGNRPLVHVLTEALAHDSAVRTGGSKADAKYQADAAIQNLLGYLKEHTDGAAPPEHVIIFDEAQRAWDEEVGQELMGRPTSEPQLFLDILFRLDWSCLVCLVGPGQEINRGEGGLALWGEALSRSAAAGRGWKVVAAPAAIDGGPEVSGGGIFSRAKRDGITIQIEPKLNLSNAIRAYRNPQHGEWVAALLDSQIDRARAIAKRMGDAPAVVTRDIDAAKEWLRARRRGGRSVGLMANSAAVRLIAEGVPPAPRSNELGPIGHWFLKPQTDFRSAGALELPMSEFGCQGLELDYVGLCWGGDLIWATDQWVPRMMRAPKWQIIREAGKQQFRLNGYRVLLTRARAGCVIYVPRGSAEDPTRSPREFDGIFEALQSAGCYLL